MRSLLIPTIAAHAVSHNLRSLLNPPLFVSSIHAGPKGVSDTPQDETSAHTQNS